MSCIALENGTSCCGGDSSPSPICLSDKIGYIRQLVKEKKLDEATVKLKSIMEEHPDIELYKLVFKLCIETERWDILKRVIDLNPDLLYSVFELHKSGKISLQNSYLGRQILKEIQAFTNYYNFRETHNIENKVIKSMKDDWDKRAKENVKYYVRSSKWDQTEEEFEASGKRSVQELIESDLSTICHGLLPSNMRVLEIGCGIGRMTKYMAEIFGEIYGIDISGEMIKEAKKRLRNYRNIFLIQNNGKELSDFEDKFFDFGFSFITFQHIPQKEIVLNYIKEVQRTLKPNSIFKFQVHGVISENYLKRPKDSWHGVSFSKDEIMEIAKDNNFAVLTSSGEGIEHFWLTFQKINTNLLTEYS